MTMHQSAELRQVVAEAQDIASQVNQPVNTAHLLLALFTVPNRAEILLKEKNIDEDSLLAHVHSVSEEEKDAVRTALRKAQQIAEGCGAEAVDCLHLLVALCGMRRSLAFELLQRAGLGVAQFRNTALSYVTGRLPRRLTIKRTAEVSFSPPASAETSAPPLAEPLEDEEDEDSETSESPIEEPANLKNRLPARSRPPTDWDLPTGEYPLLERLGRNLTALAALGKIDPLVGRERELTEVVDTLLKRRANNPLLIGEAGVGKTAIVEGLARGIVHNDPVCRPLGRRYIIELDTGSLLAGTQLRGSFSEKLQELVREVRKAQGQIIVFFDELHTLMGAGATGDGPYDAVNELKAVLARGEFPCIGATTHDEYRRFVEQDQAFLRRFRPIQVPEPSPEETLAILKTLAEEYARHHQVVYEQEALEAAVQLSSRYITERCLPDKAIQILDLAGSRARRSGRTSVDRQAIARVVSQVANIPVERLLMTDTERLLNMEKILGLQIIGHSHAIRAVANVIRRNYAGFSSRRPIGSFLFVGPTGVGKTELARALASFLFDRSDALCKLDMSEYTEPHSVARLIGAPPGYVGYQEGGQLTEAVRRRPYSIVLFDEIEKAHPDVYTLLLQILDEGRLTDGKGRTVDFSNTVVILTSNMGCEKLASRSLGTIGFGRDRQNVEQDVLATVRRMLPPELWARLDEHLFFPPLNAEEMIAIANLLLRQTAAQLEKERKVKLEFGEEVSRFLVEKGCPDFTLGARPLRTVLRRLVEEPLAELILSQRILPGKSVQLKVGESGMVFE